MLSALPPCSTARPSASPPTPRPRAASPQPSVSKMWSLAAATTGAGISVHASSVAKRLILSVPVLPIASPGSACRGVGSGNAQLLCFTASHLEDAVDRRLGDAGGNEAEAGF